MKNIKKAGILLLNNVLENVINTAVGLYLNHGHDNAWYERNYPLKLAREEAEEIFKYLQNKDIDSLTALFSEKVKSSHDIKAEWEEFFNKIDGNIVSYDGLSFPGEGMGIDKENVVFDSHLSVDL